jgi:hypothetical protein
LGQGRLQVGGLDPGDGLGLRRRRGLGVDGSRDIQGSEQLPAKLEKLVKGYYD